MDVADGSVVPVPDRIAQAHGWMLPVQLTADAWQYTVTWTAEDDTVTETVGQSETGRAGVVVSAARLAVRQEQRGGPAVIWETFSVSRIPRDAHGAEAEVVFMTVCIAGSGEQRRVTIGLAPPPPATRSVPRAITRGQR